MIRAHKIWLKPTPEQANYFRCAAGIARFVYNIHKMTTAITRTYRLIGVEDLHVKWLRRA